MKIWNILYELEFKGLCNCVLLQKFIAWYMKMDVTFIISAAVCYMKLMMKKAFIYKSFHFATEPCNLCEAIRYAPLCPPSLSLSSFSASFTFVSWHSSRLTKARAAEHTRPTTTTARYIRRDTTIYPPCWVHRVLITPRRKTCIKIM